MARASRRAWRAALLAISVAGLVAVSAGAASAHTALASATPTDGETVANAPSEVELQFAESVQGVASVTVTAPSGAAVTSGEPVHDGARVFQTLGPLTESGLYTTKYTVVADDGDEVSGALTFTYTGSSSAAPVTDPTAASQAQATPTTAASTAAAASDVDSDDDKREAGDIIIGVVILLAVLLLLFFLFRWLRRRG